MIDFDKLAEPFPADKVSWRVGSTNGEKTKGLALAYLVARDVMERLDLVCGPAGWENRYPHANGKTVCEIAILCGDRWVVKSDGAGDTDVEAEKGALSDAFKRAAVRWGIGRYLYGLPSLWVKINPRGRSYVIDDAEFPKLRKLLDDYTGVARKRSAQANRDGDFEHLKQKLAEAPDMEALGAIGREIKQALPSLPVAFRDPLHDAYLLRREELEGQTKEAA